MLISQGGITFCLLLMSLYFLLSDHGLNKDVRWLPLAILIVYFVLFTIGVANFVWLLTAEVSIQIQSS